MIKKSLKYQKYNAIFIAENIFDFYFIVLIVFMFFIFLFCAYTNFESLQSMIIYFKNNPAFIFPLFIGELILFLFFIVYLYAFFNFKIIVTPQEIILKTFKEKRIFINEISEIGRYYAQRSITSVVIICNNGKKFRYPIDCDIKNIIEFLNSINPNIKMTKKSFMVENLFNSKKNN